MMIESGSEWPTLLKPALLAANTCWKRSTGYTPFYLMYGRNANSAHLFKVRNMEFQDFLDDSICTTQNFPVNLDESLDYLDNQKKSQKHAKENIQAE